MAKKYDLCVKTGSYPDPNDPSKMKGKYLNVGVVLENDNGPYMLLNKSFNPAGIVDDPTKESVIISMFSDSAPPKDTSGKDDIPF